MLAVFLRAGSEFYGKAHIFYLVDHVPIYLYLALRQLNLKLDGFAGPDQIGREYKTACGAQVCDVAFATSPCSFPAGFDINLDARSASSFCAVIVSL